MYCFCFFLLLLLKRGRKHAPCMCIYSMRQKKKRREREREKRKKRKLFVSYQSIFRLRYTWPLIISSYLDVYEKNSVKILIDFSTEISCRKDISRSQTTTKKKQQAKHVRRDKRASVIVLQ